MLRCGGKAGGQDPPFHASLLASLPAHRLNPPPLPPPSCAQGAGVAANVLLGTSLALCTSASYASSALLPFSTAVLGCGALSFVGWAQTFFLTSKLAARWMPEDYSQVAGTFAWTLGDLG